MYTEITYTESDHIGTITIDRPDARNALTHTTYGELASSVGAEDTQAFREAINTSFMDQFPSGGGAYDAGDLPDDNPGRESDRDQGAYTSAEWYGDAQQAADDMGEDVQ